MSEKRKRQKGNKSGGDVPAKVAPQFRLPTFSVFPVAPSYSLLSIWMRLMFWLLSEEKVWIISVQMICVVKKVRSTLRKALDTLNKSVCSRVSGAFLTSCLPDSFDNQIKTTPFLSHRRRVIAKHQKSRHTFSTREDNAASHSEKHLSRKRNWGETFRRQELSQRKTI